MMIWNKKVAGHAAVRGRASRALAAPMRCDTSEYGCICTSRCRACDVYSAILNGLLALRSSDAEPGLASVPRLPGHTAP